MRSNNRGLAALTIQDRSAHPFDKPSTTTASLVTVSGRKSQGLPDSLRISVLRSRHFVYRWRCWSHTGCYAGENAKPVRNPVLPPDDDGWRTEFRQLRSRHHTRNGNGVGWSRCDGNGLNECMTGVMVTEIHRFRCCSWSLIMQFRCAKWSSLFSFGKHVAQYPCRRVHDRVNPNVHLLKMKFLTSLIRKSTSAGNTYGLFSITLSNSFLLQSSCAIRTIFTLIWMQLIIVGVELPT